MNFNQTQHINTITKVDEPSLVSVQGIQKALINGSIAAAGITIVTGATRSTTFTYKGLTYPLWQVAFAVGTGASFASDLATRFFVPHIDSNSKSQHMESMAIYMLTSGAVFYGIPKIMNPSLLPEEGLQLAAVGVAAEVVANYVNDKMLAVEKGFIASF